jgi:hypothetical protein
MLKNNKIIINNNKNLYAKGYYEYSCKSKYLIDIMNSAVSKNNEPTIANQLELEDKHNKVRMELLEVSQILSSTDNYSFIKERKYFHELRLELDNRVKNMKIIKNASFTLINITIIEYILNNFKSLMAILKEINNVVDTEYNSWCTKNKL